jgi:hypothetical protein
MATITKTFGTKLLPAYVADTIIEIVHFRSMTFDADELTAFYLDTANAIVDVGSFNIGKIPDLDGDETDIEKALAMTKAESLSNRVGLRFLTRKDNTGSWDEVAEFIILNFGRKDYLDLRGRLGYPVRIMEKNDAIAVQLVDYGDGLLWDTDFIKINFGVTVEVEKKNNVDALTARISALELALEGKLVNLPANTLLGRNVGTGTVEQIPTNRFATPAMIDQAIIDLGGGAPGALNTLMELAAALNNDANFASTVINSLAGKVDLTTAQVIAGNKIFTNSARVGSLGNIRLTPGSTANAGYLEIYRADNIRLGYIGYDNTNVSYVSEVGLHVFNGGAVSISSPVQSTSITTGALVVSGGQGVGGNQNVGGFTSLGDNNVGLKCKVITGVTAATQGDRIAIAHGLVGSKIVGTTGTIDYIGNTVPIPGNQSGYQSTISTDTVSINITNVAGSSAGILSLPFTVLIWHRP